jgi:hypothetical protein
MLAYELQPVLPARYPKARPMTRFRTSGAHAELYVHSKDGELIRVACDCPEAADHWAHGHEIDRVLQRIELQISGKVRVS